MNEREALNQSKEQIKESFNELTSNLKEYGQALANHMKSRFLNFKENVKQKTTIAKGKLGTLKNDMLQKLNPENLDVRFRNIVERVEIKGLELANKSKEVITEAKDKVETFAAEQYANYYLRQEEKMNEALEREQITQEEMAREAEIRANTKEHKEGMKEALREQARQEREARYLNFKENVKQKTTIAKGKLGTLKNNLLQKLNPSNLDVKFRNIVERVEIKGLELANKSKEVITEAKDKVETFAAEQYANYYLRQEEKMNEALEREQIAREEMAREAEIRANTKEHKEGMKEALREQAKQEREASFLNFKENTIQKVSSIKGRLGTLKNNLLQKLNPTNLDVKFRNIVEKVEIKGLELANKGKTVVNDVKDKVDNFTTEQIANYYEKKAEKATAKEFREAARQAEMEEIQRVKERKAAMKEAIYSQEREMYEQKHLDNQQRKEELMNELFGLGEEVENLHTARAM